MGFHGWLVFLHVLFVLGFVFFHGVSAMVIWSLRKERDPDRVRYLLRLSQLGLIPANAFLLGFLVTGIWAGIDAGLWTNGTLWLWAALVALIVVIVLMYGLISRYTYAWRAALASRPDLSREELTQMMATNQPMIGSAVGFVGLAVILWLMMAKPF